MIFITVGTHEQGMERLLKEVDNLIENKQINEEVFAQIGYSKYIPKNYKYKNLIGYDEMNEFIKKSQIVITHGGPGSIFHVIQNGKIPIVVPRNSSFNEHVDDHQILFTKRMQKENKIIAVYDIKDLGDKISNYLSLKNKCNIIKNNKNIFIEKFDMKIREIIKR